MSLHNITLTVDLNEEMHDDSYLLRIAKSAAELMDESHGQNIGVLRWEVTRIEGD